ncbi:MAG: HAD family hydrolase [Calothrix sp. SM1_5_4]|nr:HAD family hydrolase [Calothrix sp. SM1_5_4]
MIEQHPLIEVAEHVRREAPGVAVIFDLDSTLFNVSPRTQHILRSLANEPGFAAAHAEAAEVLKNIEVLPSDWGVREALARTNLRPSRDLGDAVRSYWREHFFSSRHLDKDSLYPSADEYVRHLHELGAEILYLTGRGEGAMREGTLRALKAWGFPLYNEASLLMKPSEVQTDEALKPVS